MSDKVLYLIGHEPRREAEIDQGTPEEAEVRQRHGTRKHVFSQPSAAKRLLRAIDCLTSYSHRRSFYTLHETARFDERHIWRCPRKAALFSDLDSLNALVEWHVRNSSAGLTCRALSAITRIRVEPHIRRISKERGLVRLKFDGEYVYFYQANEKIYLRQLAQRRRISSAAGPGLETTIEGDVASLQRDLQIAVALLNHPKEGSKSVVSRLREMGHQMTIEDLLDFFNRYGVKKKRADSL